MVTRALLLVMLLCLFAHAQSPMNVQAEVDTTTVREGESINLSLSIEGTAGHVDPEIPDMEGFEVYQVGSGMQQTIINGQISVAMTLRYRLDARKAGRYTVGPIRVEAGGQVAETRAIDVEVLPGSSPPPAHTSTFEPAPAGLDNRRSAFVTAEVDRSEPFLNQQITYILKLYLAANPLGPCGYEPPETTGFLVEELLPHSRTYTTEVDGRRYVVIEERTALFATSSGDHKLNPARVRVTLQDTISSLLMNDPFMSMGLPQDLRLETEPVEVKVRPLPGEGRPLDFGGAVGSYTMSAALDKSSVAAGQPVTLTVTVSGQGNVNLISPIVLPTLPKFRVYDTTSSSEVEKADYEVTGTRTFKTVLVPLEEGRQSIEGLRFSYFDPEAETYRTIEAPPLSLEVTPGKVSRREDAAPRPADRLAAPKTRLGSKPWSLRLPASLQALPLLAVLGALGVGAFRRWREASSSERRQSRALRRARRELKKLRSVDAVEGGRVVLSAVHGFFADRLGLNTFGLSLEELDRWLAERGLSPELRARLRQELEAAEGARYAPRGDSLGAHEKPLSRLLYEIEEAL